MPCPDLGALRASLDDAAAGTPAPLHDHVHACASCADTLAELQRNAELAAPAIALTAPDVPPSPAAVQAALTRFEQRRARLAAATPAPAADRHPRRRPRPDPVAPARGGWPGWGPGPAGWPPAWSRPWCWPGCWSRPGGRAAAAGFLAQFRSQRFEVVSARPGPVHPGRRRGRRAGRDGRVHRRRPPGLGPRRAAGGRRPGRGQPDRRVRRPGGRPGGAARRGRAHPRAGPGQPGP